MSHFPIRKTDVMGDKCELEIIQAVSALQSRNLAALAKWQRFCGLLAALLFLMVLIAAAMWGELHKPTTRVIGPDTSHARSL